MKLGAKEPGKGVCGEVGGGLLRLAPVTGAAVQTPAWLQLPEGGRTGACTSFLGEGVKEDKLRASVRGLAGGRDLDASCCSHSYKGIQGLLQGSMAGFVAPPAPQGSPSLPGEGDATRTHQGVLWG